MSFTNLQRRISAAGGAVLVAAALTCGAVFAAPQAFADEPTGATVTTPERIDLAQASAASIPATTYTGYAQTPAVKLTAAGTTLQEGIDYTLSYQSNKNAGTARVTATGMGAYTGTKTVTFTIKPASISSVKPTTKVFTYTGKAPKVKVTVKALGKTIASKTGKTTASVKLVIPKNAKKVGVHTITVKGQGNYTGTKTFSIKVKPKATKLTSVKGTSKSAIAVKWSKPANDISGYQIKYWKSGGSVKTKTVGKTKGSLTVSGLKAGTKYSVKVRAYKTISGKKYYSDWSSTKSAKTKAAPKAKTTSGTVYITDTGEKYHRGTCRYLRYSKYSISKAEAQSLGYTACKVCRP